MESPVGTSQMLVIPGHRAAMGPESIQPLEHMAQWIPGSRFVRPGMTAGIIA
jgi:hypothetical protein